MCCQSAIRGGRALIDSDGGGKAEWEAASLCGVAAEKWLSKNAVDICCFVYQLAGAE